MILGLILVVGSSLDHLGHLFILSEVWYAVLLFIYQERQMY